jgi:16S rRNA (cytosine967-C5)-methyltransferase
MESDADKEKIELPDELISAAIMFEDGAEDPSLKAFLDDVALVSDLDNYENDANAVTLMTIHSAKGLEFPTVFLPGFEEGAFTVQDISSMLVSHIAEPKEGDVVIDVCAAPGGKALHMAELLQGTGHVEARDLTDYKVNLIQDNIMRSGMNNIEAVRWDATVLDEASVEKADIVIADLPCSGLGVLGKKTDLKYKMTEQTQGELVKLQREILSTVKQYVKPGGTLVYSTCTIHEAENMGNVEWFLAENQDFQLVSVKDKLCGELSARVEDNVVREGCLQLLPGVHESDGFFIAKFKKVKHG